MSNIEVLRAYIEDRLKEDKMSIINHLGGAVLEGIDVAIMEYIQNMADVNFKVKENRKILLTINMKPLDDNRTLFHYDFDVKTKLAGREAVNNEGTAEIKVDGSKGVFAKERRRQEEGELFGKGSKVTPIRGQK